MDASSRHVDRYPYCIAEKLDLNALCSSHTTRSELAMDLCRDRLTRALASVSQVVTGRHVRSD